MVTKIAGHTFLAQLGKEAYVRGVLATNWLINKGHFSAINVF